MFILLINNVLLLPTTMKYVLHGYESANPQLWLHEIKQYTASSVTKELYTYGNIIAINLGTEVEFISTDGWLVKRYVANQEITNIVVSDSIAGIIYRDKIEIINL